MYGGIIHPWLLDEAYSSAGAEPAVPRPCPVSLPPLQGWDGRFSSSVHGVRSLIEGHTNIADTSGLLQSGCGPTHLDHHAADPEACQAPRA